MFLFLPFAFAADSQGTGKIRVAIIQDTGSLSVKASGFYEISDTKGKKSFYRGKNLKATVTAYRGGIFVGPKSFAADKVSIKMLDPKDVIVINGRKFRGGIQFIRKENQHLLVVNNIELEDYVKGILFHEVSHYWPMEALKAQAIVSRTYAIYAIKQNKSRNFDVTSDIYSQVYGGRASERYRTNKAVDETAGLIITYKDMPIPAYFHATCAGHTEDASLLWDVDMPPLKGVACNFCKESPHFNWHYVLSADEIKNQLIGAGYKAGEITEITVLGKDNSGRVTDLKFGNDRNNIKIPAKDFRNIIGPNIIRSTNFSVTLVNRDAVFEGSGWGHGVGLCQWGAYFMAKQGKTYGQILKFYYPGTDVKTLGF